MCTEIDGLLRSCDELETRLEQRVAELRRVKDVHAHYRDKMTQHSAAVEMADASVSARDQIKQLQDRIHQLNTER